MHLRSVALLALALCAAPAGASSEADGLPAASGPPVVQPFAAPPDPASLVEEERRVWAAGEDFDRSIRRARNLHRDEPLVAYVQSVLDALFHEFRGAIVLKGIVRDAEPNAFVLPNGSVYLTLGLIARLDSEAQLAVVLGHEAAHFVHRHGYQQMSSAKSMSAFGLGLGVFTGGIGAVGSVLLAGAFYGYSRDQEREADRVGFERLLRAGYPPQAGVEAFETLAAEAKLYERRQPTFFASHPSMLERVETFRALGAGSPEAGAAAEGDAARAGRFREATASARLAWLRLAVETGRQKSVIAMLEPRFAAGEIDPASACWLGEAYRLRGDDGDPERARAAYRWSLERDPGLAAAWRGVGEIARRAGRRDEALDAFEKYLEAAPDAVDRAAIAGELERLRSTDPEGRTR